MASQLSRRASQLPRQSTSTPVHDTGGLGSDQGTDTSQISDAFKTRATRIREAFYGVLFLMTHGNHGSASLEYVSMFIEDFQLIGFAVYPLAKSVMQSNDDGSFASWVARIAPLNARTLDPTHSYGSYLTWFTIMTLLVVILLLNVVQVSYGSVVGIHKRIWPIRTLRFLATVLSTFMYSPITEVFLEALTLCQYTTASDSDVGFGSMSQPEIVYCGATYHIPIYLLSIIMWTLFSVIVWLINLVYFNIDPTMKDPNAKLHGRLTLRYSISKTIVIIFFQLSMVPDTGKLVLALLFSMIMIKWTLRYSPYYNMRITCVRVSFYMVGAALAMVSLIGMATLNEDQLNTLLIVQVILILPLLPLVTFGIWKYGGGKTRSIWNRLVQLENLSAYDRANTVVFDRWEQVEMMARTATAKMDDRHRGILDQEKERIRMIFNRGLIEFPEEAYLLLSHGVYQARVLEDTVQAMKSMLQAQQHAPDSFEIGFQVFAAERSVLQQREVDYLGTNVRMDVASYASFKRSERDAERYHQAAFQARIQLWRMILNKSFTYEQYCVTAYELQESAKRAKDAYVGLLSRFPKSKTLMRRYAQFLMETQVDATVQARTLIAHADMLEEMESATGQGMVRRLSTLKSSNVASKPATFVPPPAATHAAMYGEFEMDESVFQNVFQGGIETHSEASTEATNAESRQDTRMRNTRNRIMQPLTQRVSTISWMMIALIFLSLVVMCCLFGQIFIATAAIKSYEARQFMEYDREYLSSLMVRRARMMQQSYLANDWATYSEVNTKMITEAIQLYNISQELYETRDETSVISENLYSGNSTVAVKFYPIYNDTTGVAMGGERLTVITSLFDFQFMVASSGVLLATSLPQIYADAQYDWSFRFLLDNFDEMETIYDYSLKKVLYATLGSTVSMTSTLVILVAILFILLMIVIVRVLDRRVVIFYNSQNKVIDLMREIPRNEAKVVLDMLRSGMDVDDSNENLPEAKNKSSVSTTMNMIQGMERDNVQRELSYTAVSVALGMRIIRLRYAFFIALIMFFSLCFSIINRQFLDDVLVSMQTADTFASARLTSTRTWILAHELILNDTYTWPDETALRQKLIDSAASYSYAFKRVTQGTLQSDPAGSETADSPSYNDLSPAVHDILVLYGTCQAYNASYCDSDNFNATIGFTSVTVTSGMLPMGTLISQSFDLLQMAARGTANTSVPIGSVSQPELPTPRLMAYIDSIMEPHMMDGWTRIIAQISSDNDVRNEIQEEFNWIVFGVQIVVIMIGYLFAFRRMAKFLNERSLFITNSILYVPQEVLQVTPRLARFFKMGDLEKMEEQVETTGKSKSWWKKRQNKVTPKVDEEMGLGHVRMQEKVIEIPTGAVKMTAVLSEPAPVMQQMSEQLSSNHESLQIQDNPVAKISQSNLQLFLLQQTALEQKKPKNSPPASKSPSVSSMALSADSLLMNAPPATNPTLYPALPATEPVLVESTISEEPEPVMEDETLQNQQSFLPNMLNM